MLRFGKYVIVLFIWNLHFESLHLQLIFPKENASAFGF